jgi:hypothetical protein
MSAAHSCKHFMRGPDLAICYIFKPLTNSFIRIRARRKVKQSLISLCVLHDSFGLAVHRQNHWPFRLLQLL